MRYFLYSVPLIVLLLAGFSVMAGFLGAGPAGALTVPDLRHMPLRLVLGTWLLEAFGLVALYLLIEGRSRLWWFDGLMAGWVAWIFRGPVLVITVVMAAGQPRAPWLQVTLGWWVLYTICGLALAILARWRSGLPADRPPAAPAALPPEGARSLEPQALPAPHEEK